ncbi:hypothetical protein B0A49_02150 [Cryomyces minteri]|uniref:C2H2-type domain-containing protein n=1 Tax=Cryomyces minteri TaxID=331657 RepID=A0A4U0XB50_9PEZI|nr:hypothetical protein B0A49_02150 [Cryomyces minteri]
MDGTGPVTRTMRGSVLKAVKCSYENCFSSFDTVEGMQDHKLEDPKHDYCDKCDVDCKDWEDFVEHKAEWTARALKTNSKLKLKMHQAEQDVACKYCDRIFVRAAGLMHHYESGQCKKVSAKDFANVRHHKTFVAAALKNPEKFGTTVRGSTMAASVVENEDDAGGVTLGPLEDDSEGGLALPRPLQAESDLIYLHETVESTWPALPGMSASRRGTNASVSSVAGGIRKFYIDSSSPANCRGVPKGSAGYSHITKQTRPLPSSRLSSASNDNDADTHPVWVGATSAELFPNAHPTPVTSEWSAQLAAIDEQWKKENDTNIFRVRFWDPTAPDYDPDKFWDTVLELYRCPFVDCENVYALPPDLARHLLASHAPPRPRCPTCLRIFRSTTALTAHCEAPTARCKIGISQDFDKAVMDFSGGFLETKGTDADGVVQWAGAVVREGGL